MAKLVNPGEPSGDIFPEGIKDPKAREAYLAVMRACCPVTLLDNPKIGAAIMAALLQSAALTLVELTHGHPEGMKVGVALFKSELDRLTKIAQEDLHEHIRKHKPKSS